MGLTGDAYRYGLSAGTVELTTAMCLGFAAAALFPYYIRNQVFTIPEFLEIRYSTLARTFFSGLMLVICVMTKMAFCLYAGAIVLQNLFGWEVMTTVAALGAVTAVFTMVGGFAGVAYADIIQSTIKILGCALMLAIGLYKVGGWRELIVKVPLAMHIHKPYADPIYPFWGVICGAIYGGVFYWGVDQVNVQRVLGAADLKQARWGAMCCVLLKLTPVFIFALPGVIALALFPGREPKTTFVTLLNELLPSGVRRPSACSPRLRADLRPGRHDELALHALCARFCPPFPAANERSRPGGHWALGHRRGHGGGRRRRVSRLQDAGRPL